MPLHGYLKSLDKGRISTITNLNGDKSRRKKLLPARKDDRLSSQLFVNDCVTHDPRGGVVPVILVDREPGKGWVEIGVAKCCPLCWMIIEPPDGVELPDPTPRRPPVADSEELLTSSGSKSAQGRASTKQPKNGTTLYLRAQEWVSKQDSPFDAYQMAEALDVTRRQMIPVIHLLLSGYLTVVKDSHGGRGVRKLYKKAP